MSDYDFVGYALAMEEQRRLDQQPCPTCGGDRLRADFTNPNQCHAPRKDQPND